MSLIIITSGADTYVHEGRPNQPGRNTPRPIAGNGNAKRKYTLVRSGELASLVRGCTISSAVFSWEAANDHPAHTLQIHALAAKFDPDKTDWEHRPDVRTGNPVSVDVPATQTGQRRSAEMGAFVQQLANGAVHYGFRLYSSVAANLAYVGFDDRNPDASSWRWEITVDDDSDAPVDLAPDGGAVGLPKPTVKWLLDNPDPRDAETDVQTAYRVQADTPAGNAQPSAINPAYFSGTVASGEHSHDLAAPPANTDGATPVFTAPAVGARAYWRNQVKTANAGWSDWTAWASWVRRPKGTLQILSPAPGGSGSAATPVGDSSIVVQARVVDGSVAGVANPPGTAFIEAYRIVVVPATSDTVGEPEDRRYDSGWVYTDDLTFTHEIPARWRDQAVLLDARDYRIIVRVLDRHDRVPSAGDPEVLSADVVIAYTESAAVTKPTNVTVEQRGGRGAVPRTRITVERTTAPSAWEFRRNPDGRGRELVARIDGDPTVNPSGPAEGLNPIVALGGGRWRWDYDGVPALETNEWAVFAVDNGVRSTPIIAPPLQLITYAVWLIHPTLGDVKLHGSVNDFWHSDDQRATYIPLDGSGDVDVLYGQRGLSTDQFVGYINNAPADPPIGEQIRILNAIHRRPMDKLRLVYGTANRRVMLRNFTPPVPDDDTNPQNRRHRVRFGFWEI